MLSPKKNKTFTIYSGHIIIMGHNYGQEAQISQKIGMFLLYIFKATYTLPWAIKVSPITNSYLGHMALFIVTELTKFQSK